MPISKMTVMSHGDSVVIYKKTGFGGYFTLPKPAYIFTEMISAPIAVQEAVISQKTLKTDCSQFPELRNPSDFPRIR